MSRMSSAIRRGLSARDLGRQFKHLAAASSAAGALALQLGGCPPVDPGAGDQVGVFNNTTDFTNNNAQYIGSAACIACHPGIGARSELHAHTHALSVIEGTAPTFPDEATFAGVPAPPAGFTYDDVSYVISGYLLNAFFVDREGFLITNGTAGVDSEWLLTNPENQTTAGFVEYLPDQTTPRGFDYDCFRCHTTGPQPFSDANPRRQGNRPGIGGTWVEAGVKCEACHGPGSNHAPNPAARDLFVDFGNDTCNRCHLEGDDPGTIVARDFFVSPNTQTAELLASGGHSDFNCTFCHAPHAGVRYDRANAIRNDCTACHDQTNNALHEGLVFEFGDYSEPITCESCHMPPLGRSAVGLNLATSSGPVGRQGDVRSHIYRINTNPEDFTAMFTPTGDQVVTDDAGRAAITLDHVCLRCHNAATGVFEINYDTLAQIADGIHGDSDE